MIQIFTLLLAANEVREVSVSGEYFELRNALFPIAMIELLDRNGAILARLENPEQSDFVRPGPFGTVRITNGATAQTVKHFYGTGDAGSRRTSGLVRIDGSSDVSVIDGEKNRTNAGGMFAVASYSGASTATWTAYNQLWNPGGSGKNLIVTQLSSSMVLAGSITAGFNAVPITTLSGAVANKKAGVAVGVAQNRIDNGPVAYALSGGFLWSPFVQSNAPVTWQIKGALIVPPGFGLLMSASATNSAITTNFEWFEEPI